MSQTLKSNSGYDILLGRNILDALIAFWNSFLGSQLL